MKLSIIIPTFNEAKRIGRALQEIKHFVSGRNWECEVILVDDGSKDATCQVFEKECQNFPGFFRLIKNDLNRGKGYSVRRGMMEAKGDFLLFTDADLSTPMEEAEKLIAVFSAGYDIAIGSRALRESQVEIHQNFLRESMGKIFNLLAQMLTFKGIRDSQCGFKLFKREAARKLFGLGKINGFAFDAEIIYLAQKLGYKVKEVPVLWRNVQASKVHILRDPLKMIWDLFRIRFFHGAHGKNCGSKI